MSFNKVGDRLWIDQDGRTVFATDAKPPFLIPDAAINISGYSINFPDFWSGTYYYQERFTQSTPVGNQDYFACVTYTAPIDQEWGPDAPSPNALPDAVLGTVPDGCNYIDVSVNLAWAVQPPAVLGGTAPVTSFLPQNQDVLLQGGSCLIEAGSFFRRLFTVFLDDTTVKLRRKQSVTRNGLPQVARTTPPSSAPSGSATYYFPGDNAPADLGGSGRANIGPRIQLLGYDTDANHRPARYGGQSPCSESHAGLSLASRWDGSLRIVPGRVNP